MDASGDVSLVPHGNGHILRSEPGVPAPGILELELEHPSDRYEILRHGGGGAPTTLICGAVRFDHPVARNLVGILPPMVYIQASDEPARLSVRGRLRASVQASDGGGPWHGETRRPAAAGRPARGRRCQLGQAVKVAIR